MTGRDKMRVLLRHRASHLFFLSQQTWVPEMNLAYDFQGIRNLLEAVAGLQLNDCEIVLSFPDPRYDAVLPMPTKSTLRF